MKKTGFTFIELLFVIMIIGVLVAVAVPRLKDAFDTMELSTGALRLQTFMNYLRERAIVDGKVISLRIDNIAGQYWGKAKDDDKILKSESFPKDLEITGNNGQVQFYPNGAIDKAELKITDKKGNSVGLLTSGGYGRIKLQDQK
ncbi:MAG: GspH/FimT family pseudopilin [Candidatus Omnitrophica bacterium]|nr:GspH/FimT family pseudopilin [Candidatus Omnitrophota bacterium]